MKKRWTVLLFAALLGIVFLAGCGSGNKPAASNEPEMRGETFDTGKFSVFVPDGWKAFETPDMWSDEEGAVDDTALSVYKGAESEIDMLVKCGLSFKYYEYAGNYIDPRSFYDETSNLDPITAGDNKWVGYRATMKLTESSSYHYTILTTDADIEDGPLMQIIVLEENDDEKISVEDKDVLAILGSVKITDNGGEGE